MNKSTSLRYRALSGMFRAIKVNKMLDKQGSEFNALLEEYRAKQKKPLRIPYKKMRDKFDIDTKCIDGVTCYVVRQKSAAPDKAVLYLFGGGYILPPDPGDIVLCGQIAENCNAEVWFPMYPMAPDNDLVHTLKGTLGVYRDILDHYDADRIRFFGTSSGGGQALSLCMYIRHEGLDVPLPGRLVLQSPGLQVPPSDKQRAEMDRLSHLDVMIPPGFFDSIAPVLATGDDAYLLSPILFDLTGFPPIDIFYGTNEVMIAYLDDFRAKCSECGVELNVHIGEGMMHCWGAMDFVPEAKAVRQEYFKAIGTRRNDMDLKFGDVQETALITLAIRASETARADARISDPAAKEIIDTLGVDVSKYDPFLSHEGVVARTIMYRDALKKLIAQYPDAVCINLGCGFDDKFPQVDNGRIRWYDVDLADQIAVRRKVFDDRERCTMMDGDALDGAWTKNIPESDMYIIVMEGVLEYFSKEQVKTCLNMLCDSFKHGYLLAIYKW